MSLSIKNISPSDGRLSSKRSATDAFKWRPSETHASTARYARSGYLVSTSKTTRIRKNNQLLKNANDAISLIHVADGALDATTAALREMRSLSTQTTEGIKTSRSPFDLLVEKMELTEEIGKIFSNTKFDNQSLLNGSVHDQVYSVGDTPDRMIPVSIENISTIVSALRAKMSASVTENQVVNNQEVADAQVEVIDHALGSVTQIRTTLDSLQNRFEDAIAQLHHTSKNTEEKLSQILDAKSAAETASIARNVIFQHMEVSLSTQANQQPQVAMKLLE